MGNINTFWESLSVFQQIFYCIAIPATVILVIQTILTIIGIDSHHSDFDSAGGHFDVQHDAHDQHVEHADGFRVFTIRGIVAFFAIFGWTGIALSKASIPEVVNVIISFAAGILAMFVIAALFYGIMKLQSSGTMNLRNAIGKTGTVYLTIPEKRTGKGKVQINIQEQLTELYAQTDDNKPLSTGLSIKVLDIEDQNTLIVTANK